MHIAPHVKSNHLYFLYYLNLIIPQFQFWNKVPLYFSVAQHGFRLVLADSHTVAIRICSNCPVQFAVVKLVGGTGAACGHGRSPPVANTCLMSPINMNARNIIEIEFELDLKVYI